MRNVFIYPTDLVSYYVVRIRLLVDIKTYHYCYRFVIYNGGCE